MHTEETAPILRKLLESITEENDEKVLRYSEQVLIMTTDPEISRCKIIALIKLNKYEQAMQIQKSLKIETEDQAFIKGYLSYKLNKYKDSIEIIEGKHSNGYINKIL